MQALLDFGLVVGRRSRAAIWPALARLYRNNPATASRFVLYALGVADPSYRGDFATLARITDRMPQFDGCIIECGVYRGGTILGMAHRLNLRGIHDVRLIGCDSFEGFPPPSREDALRDGTIHKRALQGVHSDTNHERLLSQIAALGYADNIKLVKGYFEAALPMLSGERFSIAHIDCDLYYSYMTCLEFLYPRMVKGGYMIFDDYFSAPVYPGARKAVDEFFANKPEKVQWFNDVQFARAFAVKA